MNHCPPTQVEVISRDIGTTIPDDKRAYFLNHYRLHESSSEEVIEKKRDPMDENHPQEPFAIEFRNIRASAGLLAP